MLDMIKRWPVKVTIFFPREGGHIIDHDRARRIVNRRTKKHEYKLKKYKDILRPGDYTHVFRGVKGDELLLISPSRGEYYQMGMYTAKVKCEECGTKNKVSKRILKPLNEDMKFWFINIVERAFAKYQTKTRLEQYMPIILVALFAMALVFVFWGGAQYIQAMQGQASALVSAAEALMKAAQSFAGSGGLAPPI